LLVAFAAVDASAFRVLRDVDTCGASLSRAAQTRVAVGTTAGEKENEAVSLQILASTHAEVVEGSCESYCRGSAATRPRGVELIDNCLAFVETSRDRNVHTSRSRHFTTSA